MHVSPHHSCRRLTAVSCPGLLRVCAGLGVPSATLRPLLSALDALTLEQVAGALGSGDRPPVGPLAAACHACQALAQREGMTGRASPLRMLI